MWGVGACGLGTPRESIVVKIYVVACFYNIRLDFATGTAH